MSGMAPSGPVGPGIYVDVDFSPKANVGLNGPAGPSGPEPTLRHCMWQLREELTEEDVIRIWREVLVGEVMDE